MRAENELHGQHEQQAEGPRAERHVRVLTRVMSLTPSDNDERARSVPPTSPAPSVSTVPSPGTGAVECCCARRDCAFLQANARLLSGLERDVHTAARLGQALLVRHETYMADAETERIRMSGTITSLESEKQRLQTENASTIEQNKTLLSQLEELNAQNAVSESKVEGLTATLASTQLELRRLTQLAGRATELEFQLTSLETEQSRLQQGIFRAEENETCALQRWKRAERTLKNVEAQLERVEAERTERSGVYPTEAGSGLNGRNESGEKHPGAHPLPKPGSNAAPAHFVRDILSDNASLQSGVVELRDMLAASNEEVENLRTQLALHQHQQFFSMDSQSLDHELGGGGGGKEVHVHHHYHGPAPPAAASQVAPTGSTRRKRRRGMVQHPRLPGSTSTTSTGVGVGLGWHARTDTSNTVHSSIPASPSSVFDRGLSGMSDPGMDSSRPTTPDSACSPLFAPKDPKDPKDLRDLIGVKGDEGKEGETGRRPGHVQLGSVGSVAPLSLDAMLERLEGMERGPPDKGIITQGDVDREEGGERILPPDKERVEADPSDTPVRKQDSSEDGRERPPDRPKDGTSVQPPDTDLDGRERLRPPDDNTGQKDLRASLTVDTGPQQTQPDDNPEPASAKPRMGSKTARSVSPDKDLPPLPPSDGPDLHKVDKTPDPQYLLELLNRQQMGRGAGQGGEAETLPVRLPPDKNPPRPYLQGTSPPRSQPRQSPPRTLPGPSPPRHIPGRISPSRHPPGISHGHGRVPPTRYPPDNPGGVSPSRQQLHNVHPPYPHYVSRHQPGHSPPRYDPGRLPPSQQPGRASPTRHPPGQFLQTPQGLPPPPGPRNAPYQHPHSQSPPRRPVGAPPRPSQPYHPSTQPIPHYSPRQPQLHARPSEPVLRRQPLHTPYTYTAYTPPSHGPSLPTAELHRSNSNESLLSISGMDIHIPATGSNSHSRTAQAQALLSRPLVPSRATEALSSAHATAQRPKPSLGRGSSDYTRTLLSGQAAQRSPEIGPGPLQPPGTGQLRRIGEVGGWVFGRWGAPKPGASDTSTGGVGSDPPPKDAPTTAPPTDQAAKHKDRFRPPGVNQAGPILGLRPPGRALEGVVMSPVNEEVLRESLNEG